MLGCSDSAECQAHQIVGRSVGDKTARHTDYQRVKSSRKNI